MITQTAWLSVPELLQVLRMAQPPETGVLSAYVDTSPDRIRNQAYLLAFRDGCKATRGHLAAPALDAFQAAALQAESVLAERSMTSAAGVALFSGADYLFVGALPGPPVERIGWDTRAHIEPLVATLDELERVAVVLFDKERTRLFSIFLGETEETQVFEDDVPGKQATGGWFGLAQTRYARHHEAHVLRHAKRTVLALADLLRSRPFDRLFIGGPDEAVSLLRAQLPRPLRLRLAGTLSVELFASDSQVLQKALEAAEVAEREHEIATVHELLRAAGTGHVALGVRSTLEALNERRVHLLVVADSFTAQGAECPDCRYLAERAVTCPICGHSLTRSAELRELAVELAAVQGARIEEVAGEAAATLMERGGIGALTHY